MIKRTNSLELLKWIIWTTFSAIGLGYVTILTFDTVFLTVPESLYSAGPLLLTSLGFWHLYARQFSRLDNHLPIKERKELTATNARSIKVNQKKTLFLSSVSSIFATGAPQSPVSGLLWWQYGSYIIYEDTLYEWLRKGWKRQTWQEPHPFSGNWMIKQRFYTLGNQTIERGLHDMLCVLATNYMLWLKEPRQGVAGKLRLSPNLCMEKLHGRLKN